MSDEKTTQTAQPGDTVLVNYRGSYDSPEGEVFDSSFEREPVKFKIGSQTMIPGFESLVTGMSPGETKEEVLAPDEAYGPHREDYIMKMSKDKFPDDFEFEIGLTVQGSTPDGLPVLARIVENAGQEVTLDFNHPLSGRTLNFKVELLDILNGAEDEISR